MPTVEMLHNANTKIKFYHIALPRREEYFFPVFLNQQLLTYIIICPSQESPPLLCSTHTHFTQTSYSEHLGCLLF